MTHVPYLLNICCTALKEPFQCFPVPGELLYCFLELVYFHAPIWIVFVGFGNVTLVAQIKRPYDEDCSFLYQFCDYTAGSRE